jgi:hypothetical protein
MDIVKQIVSVEETKAVHNLLQDDDSKFMMLKSLGQRFLQKDEIFVIDSPGQIMLLIANAPFLHSDTECIQITHIIQWGMKKVNIFPMVTEHKKQDLAYRCLLALGFFKKAMEKRTQYRGAPTINFYREIGIQEFKRIGFEEVSQDFIKWEGYLSEITC